MPALFPRWANTAARASLIAVACLAVGIPAVLMAWVRTPTASNQHVAVAQPIPFNHTIHVRGLGIDCRFCHFSVERSPTAGMPPTTACIGCHNQTWMKSAILAPVRNSATTSHAMVWQRVNALPDFVYFNHAIHVNKGVGCETCHGRIDEMAQVQQAAPLTMGWCVNCHRDPRPFLRPVAEITTMGWKPPQPQAVLGATLARQYAVRSLTDCSTCHR